MFPSWHSSAKNTSPKARSCWEVSKSPAKQALSHNHLSLTDKFTSDSLQAEIKLAGCLGADQAARVLGMIFRETLSNKQQHVGTMKPTGTWSARLLRQGFHQTSHLQCLKTVAPAQVALYTGSFQGLLHCVSCEHPKDHRHTCVT